MGKVACEGNVGELEPDDGSVKKISMMNDFLNDHPNFSPSRLLRALKEFEWNYPNVFYKDRKICYTSEECRYRTYNLGQRDEMETAAKENPQISRMEAGINWVSKYGPLYRKEWMEIHEPLSA